MSSVRHRVGRAAAVWLLVGVIAHMPPLGSSDSATVEWRGVQTLSAQAVNPPQPPPQDTVDLGGVGYAEGPDSAPVKVAEFSDFACGFCRQFHETVYPDVWKKHIATG
jgi:protein-disulfide isomerase